MKKLSILIIPLLFASCAITSIDKSSQKIIKDYKSAINKSDYNRIKRHLSNSLMVDNMDYNSTWIMFYSYVNFGQNEKIKDIQLDKIETISDSLGILYLTQNFKDGGTLSVEMNLIKGNKKWKISRISNFMPKNFKLTTRASFTIEDVFGNDRVNNICNLKIMDKSKSDSIVGSYTIYYDSKGLKQYAEFAMKRFYTLDSLLLNNYKFESVHREKLLLTSINSRNTITIGKGLDIPWVISLSGVKSENIKKLNVALANTYSHEIVEGTLLNKYNLKSIKFRWFRDGLSEYLAYKYSLMIAPSSAKSYFLENRQADFLKNRQNGNLLDWRGPSPNPAIDTGKLYGTNYIYENNNGQYGRAFMFFKDSFENNEQLLINILSLIYLERKDITVEKLLKIMSKEMDENVVKKLSEY